MTHTAPYVLEAMASVSLRMLVFAESQEAADEILGERAQELYDALAQRGNLDLTNEAILFEADSRPAMGLECLGSHALTPGLIEFDECDHEEHRDGGDEGGE